jgi:hypothetical protein
VKTPATMTTKLIALVLGVWPITQVWADPPELLRMIRNARDAESRQIYATAGAAVNVLERSPGSMKLG